MLTLREASPQEVLGWDDMVTRFAGHRITHTQAWIRSLEASAYGRPLYLVFEKDGRIAGCLPGLLATLGPLRLYGSPLPGWETVSMGPVFDPAALSTGDVATALVPFLETRYGVHHVEIVSRVLDRDAMHALGFRGEMVPTYRAPLYPGEQQRALHALKENARRNIRRAAKLGLVVEFEQDQAFVDEHYEQLKEVYVRGGNTITFTRRRVLECFRHMHAVGKLLAVSVYLSGERVNIATGMFTVDGRELLLWTWAHRTQYRWYRPTEIMTWTVMQKAMQAGCETFDLMGLGAFKTKFGAAPDETKDRWVRSRYPWLTQLRDWAETSHRWQRSVRGRVARLARSRLEKRAATAGGPNETDG